MNSKHIIGITIGDFNGIGPELILRTFQNEAVFNYCDVVVYATPYILSYYQKALELPPLDVNTIRSKKDIKHGVINLRNCYDERLEITPGEPSEQSGKLAFSALQLAVKDVKDGLIMDILTAPIDKDITKSAGLTFNGHTEYFAQEFNSEALMLLMHDSLKVAMVTGHNSIQDVSSSLTQEKIENTLAKLNDVLRSDFLIDRPKIAVLGLNPHLGDNGQMGNEESTVIQPAVSAAQDAGVLAYGPFPPDGFFGSKNEGLFDAVVGMYHDQVLIPFKKEAFEDGINYTGGLPIVRTSPDHGTAFDIAGKGVANITSFVNALFAIKKIHRNRKEFYSKADFLPFREHRKEKFSIGVPDLN